MREVQLPRGVLSGLSRRVSSLFFGGGAAETQETRRVVCGEERGVGVLFVLTDTHLQRWKAHNDTIEVRQWVWSCALLYIVEGFEILHISFELVLKYGSIIRPSSWALYLLVLPHLWFMRVQMCV